MTQTFKKAERLSSKTIIEKLFESGRSFNLFPFRVVWSEEGPGSPFPAQLAIAVPKKNFKKAVDRNKLKRRTREAYRKNKDRLYSFLGQHKKKIALMLIYTAKEQTEYSVIETKINGVIDRLIREIDEAGK